MTERLRLDANELTLRELGAVAELLGAPLSEVMESIEQHRGIAALACIIMRRTDPTYTLEQALDLRIADMDVVPPPNRQSASNGASPLASAELGT